MLRTSLIKLICNEILIFKNVASPTLNTKTLIMLSKTINGKSMKIAIMIIGVYVNDPTRNIF